MTHFLSRTRLYLATDSLDWMINRSIKQSLSLQDAVPLSSGIDCVPDKPIETLYIHIPFCHTLCRFCSFHKVKFQESLAREYFQALRQEIRQVIAKGYRFNRVYIGGGTTTILEDELIKTIELIKSLTTIREVSCESDPIYFKEGHPELLKGLVDRMSIGVQSFDDAILKITGRFEKFGSGLQQAEYVSRAIELFPTVNVDMMYGFKMQTADSVHADLLQTMALNPDQITTYPLTIGIGKNRKKAGCLAGPAHELWPQFLAAKQALADRYVMEFPWTFSRSFGQSVQNKYVLDGEDCLGVGSGAFGRFGEQFRISSFDIADYIRLIDRVQSGTCYIKPLESKALIQHYLMIMMGHGHLDNQVLKAHTGRSLWQALPLEMSFLLASGAIVKRGDNYRTTEQGQFIALKMFVGFLTGMDHLREQARELPLI
ncbi:coproporphyrinogen III oxidase family protein [Shewanella psychropiezotolerans]|uniref:Coproporphyrinogen III oxidase family protein n=1 Tax=Shewanella psychropiezotolerans TaxID=2593655 RepID=A0ABX5WVC8_9GAMM|nr:MULTISPECIES: coproporphyrinogen III oxidase family protein [Shewanella]MPY22651.1 coproporphyrinogen III oxidase family protein [Shewanella sp. YLB-07]QDO83055.1 coproporphyrinogen III oxidase family protein [Shewanella psychropiezotolerans]